MPQWSALILVSSAARIWPLLLRTLLLAALLLLPWCRWWYGMVTLALLARARVELLLTQKRVATYHGEIIIGADGSVCWQGVVWRLVEPPMVTPWGVALQMVGDGRWQRLWITDDSLAMPKWRELCRFLRQLDQANPNSNMRVSGTKR